LRGTSLDGFKSHEGSNAHLSHEGSQGDPRNLRSLLRRLNPNEARRGPAIGEIQEIEGTVREILEAVRSGGDQALLELSERFDGMRPASIRVPAKEIEAAREGVAAPLREALGQAAEAVKGFHEAELAAKKDFEHKGTSGIVTRELLVPVDRAGCYAPGGRAPLASSVLMTVIPAKVAGVGQVAVASPPGPDGHVATPVLAAAAISGADEVYALGGAQAMAALAYGTETVKRVDLVVGPGNRYVATAQRILAGEGVVGVPSAFAGPSEVVVVADGSWPAENAAIDLLVQAEHGPDGLAWLVTWSETVATAVEEAVDRLAESSPRRQELLATLAAGGWSVLVDGPREAMEVCNIVAPEHLELITEDPEELLGSVRSAGAVFLGPWAPASVGDYIAGPSHVLPTARSARFSSALGTQDFLKRVHAITVEPSTLARVSPHVVALAEAEGLAAHAASVLTRLGQAGASR
jgi:histidinol dehydrogenase